MLESSNFSKIIKSIQCENFDILPTKVRFTQFAMETFSGVIESIRTITSTWARFIVTRVTFEISMFHLTTNTSSPLPEIATLEFFCSAHLTTISPSTSSSHDRHLAA